MILIKIKKNLPDLHGALGDYVNCEGSFSQNFHSFGHQQRSPPNAHLPFESLQVWYKVCVQQQAYFDPRKTALTFTIHAHPPDRHWKYGQYDAAILSIDQQFQWPLSGLSGMVQILLVLTTSHETGHNIVLI